jgi:hypothetical protein
MSLTQELDSPPPAQPGASREQQPPFAVSQSPFAIRDVPVVLLGREALPAGAEVTLHYERVHVEGLLELIPSEIEIDISSLSGGGAIRIDQLPLPPCCEVIGVWFTNPVVTVA